MMRKLPSCLKYRIAFGWRFISRTVVLLLVGSLNMSAIVMSQKTGIGTSLGLPSSFLDWNWLVGEARRRGVQNRLGFVVSLALRAGAGTLGMERLTRLAAVEEELFACRLEREETRWLRVAPARRPVLAARRGEEAVQWGVPSVLRPADLRFLGGL